jgi:hypothetical protein
MWKIQVARHVRRSAPDEFGICALPVVPMESTVDVGLVISTVCCDSISVHVEFSSVTLPDGSARRQFLPHVSRHAPGHLAANPRRFESIYCFNRFTFFWTNRSTLNPRRSVRRWLLRVSLLNDLLLRYWIIIWLRSEHSVIIHYNSFSNCI